MTRNTGLQSRLAEGVDSGWSATIGQMHLQRIHRPSASAAKAMCLYVTAETKGSGRAQRRMSGSCLSQEPGGRGGDLGSVRVWSLLGSGRVWHFGSGCIAAITKPTSPPSIPVLFGGEHDYPPGAHSRLLGAGLKSCSGSPFPRVKVDAAAPA
jgi:hypothetical protein